MKGLRGQRAQSLVEWAVAAMVLVILGLGLLAVGQVVAQATAVSAAASHAALAAARAPNDAAAHRVAQEAAQGAVQRSQVEGFRLTLATAGFQRGGTLTATAEGYVTLTEFPIVSQMLGGRIRLTSQAHALIEPYRSRTAQ